MAAGQMSQKELRSDIMMQSMFTAKNLRGQRDRLLGFKIQLQQTAGDPIEEVLDEVSISNHLLQSQLQLQHTPGDPIEDLLPSLDETWKHDRKVRPPAGDPIEEVVSGFGRVCLLQQTPRDDPIKEVDEAFMRDGILHFELLLQQPPEDPVKEVVSGLAEVCFHGLEAAAGYLNLCLRRASQNGARLAPNPSFTDEQKLFDALAAAQRLPARPTTQAEALSRVQAALYAVKLPQEHLLPRCIGHLSPTDPAAGSSSSMDDARTTLDDAYILLNLAIKHIDLAVAAISPLVHPNEVASCSRFADSYTTFGWDELRVTMNMRLLNRLVTSKGRGGAEAGRMSEKTLVSIIVMHSMLAAKNIPAQRDRLLQFKMHLQQTPTEEVVSGLAKVRFAGLKYAARYLTICLDRAAQTTGALLAPNPSFSDLNQLFDALEAAKRLPARPTTQTEAFSRIQAALYAVKLTQEHLLPRCIGHLSPTDPAAGSSRMDDARIFLDGSCTVLNIAIKHIDLAVAFMSTFVHPNEVASNSRFADRYTDFGWAASASLPVVNLLNLV